MENAAKSKENFRARARFSVLEESTVRSFMSVVLGFVLLFSGTQPAHAVTIAADPAIAAPISAFVAGFNAAWKGGSTAFPGGIFSADIVIIDLFPPFRWSGTAEAMSWYATIMPRRSQWATAAEQVTLGTPFVTVMDQKKLSRSGSGDAAYVVYPAVLSYRDRGRATRIEGRWAFVLKRSGGHWVITAHSWATTTENPPRPITYEVK